MKRTSVVIVLALVALAVATARAEIIERVLVKVNGDILTQTDLEARQSAAIRQRKENPQTMTNAELNKVLAEITPQIIRDTVDELLLLQRGKELGYHLTDEKFKQILENIKKENKFETEEAFQTALKTENMTLAELRKSLEKSMIVQQVQSNEVLGRISIAEAEGKAYYEAHKSEFTTPATMMLREVLATVPTKAQGFSVAQDAASKANGGLIGPIGVADLEPSLRAIFQPLKAGDITPVIRTASGYQIFKVDTLTESTIVPWDKAREEIGNRVAATKQAAEFVKYMQKLRAQAVIDWKNPELKKMFDQKVAEELSAADRAAGPEKKGPLTPDP